MATPKDPPLASTEDLPEAQQVALKLFVTLTRASAALLAHAQDDIRSHGLSIGEFAVLELLYHRGQTLLGEIQKKVLVSSGGITFLVDKLVEKGLVTRRDCPGDRRARYAVLTRDGHRLMKRIFPRHARRITDAVGALTLSRQRDLTRTLRSLGLTAEEAMPDE